MVDAGTVAAIVVSASVLVLLLWCLYVRTQGYDITHWGAKESPQKADTIGEKIEVKVEDTPESVPVVEETYQPHSVAEKGSFSEKETDVNQVTCGTRPDKCNLTDPGKKYNVVVPDCDGTCSHTVWGIDPFTADSALCRAARFAGLDPTKPFSMTAMGPLDGVKEGEQNGVAARSYGWWGQNYSLSRRGEAPGSAPAVEEIKMSP